VHAVAEGRVRDLFAVDLAVSEAVTNAVVHAYRDRHPGAESGQVRITVTVEDGELLVVVSDEGMGLAPRLDSPGAGLGLPLMATLADRFEVQNLTTGTRLLLGFQLASSAAA
jgi:serine/threonine-protein kinase RsbW/stage II sporulation protein AB (anti-sigma F factor)